MAEPERRINLDEARWDQSTFVGRFKHFFAICDPRKAVYTNAELDKARDLVNLYKYVYHGKGESTSCHTFLLNHHPSQQVKLCDKSW